MVSLQNIVRFIGDESGASAIEYAFLASLIGVALVGAFDILGSEILQTFDYIAASLPIE